MCRNAATRNDPGNTQSTITELDMDMGWGRLKMQHQVSIILHSKKIMPDTGG